MKKNTGHIFILFLVKSIENNASQSFLCAGPSYNTKWKRLKGALNTPTCCQSLTMRTRPFYLEQKCFTTCVRSPDGQDETTRKENDRDAVHLDVGSMHRCLPAQTNIHTTLTRYKQIRPKAKTSKQNACHMLISIVLLYKAPSSCHRHLLFFILLATWSSYVMWLQTAVQTPCPLFPSASLTLR